MKANKMTDELKEEMYEMLNTTNIALQLMSRGRVWLEVTKDTAKNCGSDEDNDVIRLIGEEKPDLRKVLDHFGWEYEETDDGITGEGIIAFTLFNILMARILDNDMTRDIFRNLHLSLAKDTDSTLKAKI